MLSREEGNHGRTLGSSEGLSSRQRHAAIYGVPVLTKNVTNIAASVRQRLANRARERKEDFGLLLTKYALERLLFRIGQSEHRKIFVLKGALLLNSGRSKPTARHGTPIFSPLVTASRVASNSSSRKSVRFLSMKTASSLIRPASKRSASRKMRTMKGCVSPSWAIWRGHGFPCRSILDSEIP